MQAQFIDELANSSEHVENSLDSYVEQQGFFRRNINRINTGIRRLGYATVFTLAVAGVVKVKAATYRVPADFGTIRGKAVWRAGLRCSIHRP